MDGTPYVRNSEKSIALVTANGNSSIAVLRYTADGSFSTSAKVMLRTLPGGRGGELPQAKKERDGRANADGEGFSDRGSVQPGSPKCIIERTALLLPNPKTTSVTQILTQGRQSETRRARGGVLEEGRCLKVS